jgi:inosine/xanthosine triphosphatase
MIAVGGGGKKLIVAAGTRNPAKIEGIRRGFDTYFPDVEVIPVDSSHITKAQPRGLEEMVVGASLRARFALSNAGGDFGVGVEAGIFRIEGVYFDNQLAAVADRSGRFSLGHSAGYSLPREAIENLFADGQELERWAERVSSINEVGDKGGLINYLTKGKMSRADLTEQCVVTALIPWLHPKLYGF